MRKTAKIIGFGFLCSLFLFSLSSEATAGKKKKKISKKQMIAKIVALEEENADLKAALQAGALPVAVDAYGFEIGKVLRVDTSLRMMQVSMDAGGLPVVVNVWKDSFSHGSRPLVYFDAPGCVGQAYITTSPSDSALGTPAAVAGEGDTLYLGSPDAAGEREMASLLHGEECRPFEVSIDVMPADPVMALGFVYFPPYEILP